MNLKRFNEFVREVGNDLSLQGYSQTIEVARRFQGVWYRDDRSQIADDRLVADLELTLGKGRPWRYKNEYRAYFPVQELEAVVVIWFPAKPTSGTRQQFHGKILSCFKRSSDSYRAQHDELTALLNRRAFDATLARKLGEFRAPVFAINEGVAQEGIEYSSIILMYLDIDFFKRVNDNYGHTYGDLVLKAFAIRLERASEALSEKYTTEVYCARPSGEEFAVLFAGSIRSDDELEVAEFLRNAIASTPLPDAPELCAMAGDPKLREIALPPIAERQITPSIGVASRHSAGFAEATETIAERLRIEADLGLYRAKALGRNRCVRFCDIVQTHGQVIEHHSDVDVVAIDLGQQVGVSTGQEFLVFHPDFVGSKSFLLGDSRSERKLGYYPRIPHGRLEVFDVQQEIAFSYVAEKRGIDRFPVGALLEAVPVGSIAHLIHKDWWRWRDLQALAPSQEDIERELSKITPWETAGVACVGLRNREKLLISRGAGLINRIYASLYNNIRECLKGDFVAQVQSDILAVVLRREINEVTPVFERLIENVQNEHDSLPHISVGIFARAVKEDDEEEEKKHDNDSFEIDFEHALECAKTPWNLLSSTVVRFRYLKSIPSTGFWRI